jgi:SAM-dependent methyltransferase
MRRGRWIAALILAAAVLASLPYLATRGYLGIGVRDWVWAQQSRRLFDSIFRDSVNPPFRVQPNAYMMRMLEGRKPGLALDVATGQGRNGLWLARQGWTVTGFDISEAGLAAARKSADRDNLPFTAVRETVDDFDYGREKWDLILLIYAPAPFDNPAVIARIRDSLKPGGLLLVESQVEWKHGNTRERPPGSLEPDQLWRVFSGLRVLDYHEVQGVSDWFPRLTLIARMLAQK